MRNDLDLDFFAALGLFAIGTIINSTLLKEDSITNFSSKIATFFMNVLCKFNLCPVSMGSIPTGVYSAKYQTHYSSKESQDDFFFSYQFYDTNIRSVSITNLLLYIFCLDIRLPQSRRAGSIEIKVQT